MLLRNLILLMVLCLPVFAADRITLTITVTNAPANNDTLEVNADTRTAKTTVATPSTEFEVGADAGFSATNLWGHIVGYRFTGLTPAFSSTNIITLKGETGKALTAAASGTWATLTYETQNVAQAVIVRVPFSAEPTAAVREANANHLAADMGTHATAGFAAGTTLVENLVQTTGVQTVAGAKTFTGANAHTNTVSMHFNGNLATFNTNGIVWTKDSAAVSTNTHWILTGDGFGFPTIADSGGNAPTEEPDDLGGVITLGVLQAHYPVLTDSGLVNVWERENAFNVISAIDATLTNVTVIAGDLDSVTITNAVNISGNINTLENGLIDGSTVTNATYYGTVGALTGGTITTTTLASPTTSGTATLAGTTIINGTLRVEQQTHTSLANGNNAGVVFTDPTALIQAGPTAAFAINGIAGGAEGRRVTIINNTGFAMTISNDSGLDATAANRIYTWTGSDIATTADGVVVLEYVSALSRWAVISIRD